MKFDKKFNSKSGGSEKFLRIKDGESVNGVCRGEVYEKHVKWEGKRSQDVPAGTPGSKTRFLLNFVTYVDGKFVAKIFDFPISVYEQLAEINKEYDLEKIKIKISRKGSGMGDTEWNVLPLLSQKDVLTPAILAQIEAVPLNILDAKPKAQHQAVDDDFGDPPPEAYDHSEIPF